jgi:hypothetical protein
MSVPNFDCYEDIIGLYQGDCNCLDGRPAYYNVSDSGLYISDLLEPKFIDGLLNCDQGDSVWELMEIVRNLAIRNFIADSNALLMKTSKLKRSPYYGGLGLSTYTKDLALQAGYYSGVRMISPLIKSGYLKIKKIGMLFNQTNVVNINIYDRNATLLYTLDLNTTANAHNINDVSVSITYPVGATEIVLPLFDDYLDYIEYWFVYQLPAGMQPKNNSLYACQSCLKSKPAWGDFYYSGKHPWTNWINIGGFSTSGLPDFMDANYSGSDYLNGMTFQVEMGCMVNEVFCKDALDFEGNTLAQAMAIAIQKLSAKLFVDKVQLSGNINWQRLINGEQLQKSKEEWQASYNEMISYIAENVNIDGNDCFECKDMIEMIKGGIMS